jgi:hypothetical protein
MAYNNSTLQFGDGGARRVPATVASEIKVGNHLVLVSNKAELPSELSDAGTEAQNQEAAHDIYLGVAADQKLADDTRDILVYTRGVHKFPCAALGQAYDIGAYFGLAGTGSGDAVGVSDTLVKPVATANLAIGRLAQAAASGATEVLVEIAGVLTTPHAGAQALA